MKPVAVLGCGPAGLLAAHAIALRGKPVAIFSKPQKSRLGGAQFLHMAIPGLTDNEPEAIIKYKVEGDAATYRKKVYGSDNTVPFVSFTEVKDGQEQEAWSLLGAYDRLWDIFGESVNDVDINPQWLQSSLDRGDFSNIISTVPLVHLCKARAGLINEIHRFSVQTISVLTEPYHAIDDMTIWYDGTEDHSWYRSSNLFGHHGTEWSNLGRKPDMDGLVTDSKPIATTCDCWRQDVMMLGRRGSWAKGQLTHHAFLGAVQL